MLMAMWMGLPVGVRRAGSVQAESSTSELTAGDYIRARAKKAEEKEFPEWYWRKYENRQKSGPARARVYGSSAHKSNMQSGSEHSGSRCSVWSMSCPVHNRHRVVHQVLVLHRQLQSRLQRTSNKH